MNKVTTLFKSQVAKVLVNPSRTAGLWNKDYMPGPYPETPAQRAAAAKKYNLLPEEYEPDPEGFGDYPKLPMISGDTRDNWYNWDMPELKKDYGEPMHTMFNLISEDRWDCNQLEKSWIHPGVATAMYVGVIILFFIPVWYFEDKKSSLPHMKQHFPADGVHYKYPSKN